MADIQEGIQQQVETILHASFAQQPEDEQDTNTQGGTEQRHVLDVDLYHLEGGAVLLVPKHGTNPLDINAIESDQHTPQQQVPPGTEPPPVPLVEDEPQEEGETLQEQEPKPPSTSAKRGRQASFVLLPLLSLCLVVAGTLSYVFLLPLTATATITITPKARSLHTDTTFPIATHPKAGQVQGRPLVASSFTKSIIVPATGHGHDDATASQGVITFYNADTQNYTISTGTSFTVQGVTVVTDTSTTVQAVVPPMLGTASAPAHVVQAGVGGNIPAHALSTSCCGSPFLTATNISAFSGGQDARSYNFIQTSDIQHAATDLLQSLTPQATEAFQKQARPGEQVVTPLCSSHTQESAEPGTEGASVTVSVTQTCSSVAYLTDSLTQVATRTLAHLATLSHFEEVGTTQVTVNGSTYANHTATLKVTLAGVWVYHFTKAKLQQFTHQITGESQEKAQTTLERVDGVASVSIHVQRLDFKDQLPINPQRIHVQFWYIVS